MNDYVICSHLKFALKKKNTNLIFKNNLIALTANIPLCYDYYGQVHVLRLFLFYF